MEPAAAGGNVDGVGLVLAEVVVLAATDTTKLLGIKVLFADNVDRVVAASWRRSSASFLPAVSDSVASATASPVPSGI